MPQRQTNLPPANYKTFSELAEYAKARARISAKRRGHQEFAYWMTIYYWANDCEAEGFEPLEEFMSHRLIANSPAYDVMSKAEAHALAVHCSIILRNRGARVPKLSLNWLREEARKL